MTKGACRLDGPIVIILHGGLDFGIFGCRRGDEVIGQGPYRIRLAVFNDEGIAFVLVLAKLRPDRFSQRDALGRRRASRCHVLDQSQTVAVQLPCRALHTTSTNTTTTTASYGRGCCFGGFGGGHDAYSGSSK